MVPASSVDSDCSEQSPRGVLVPPQSGQALHSCEQQFCELWHGSGWRSRLTSLAFQSVREHLEAEAGVLESREVLSCDTGKTTSCPFSP